MSIQQEQSVSRSRAAVRVITLFNLFLFMLFVIPPAHRWIDLGFRALRSAHLEEPVGLSLQVWLVGSTLLASGLLLRMVWHTRRKLSAGIPSVSLRLEATLVIAWWAIVIGTCAYGFMLGMAG